MMTSPLGRLLDPTSGEGQPVGQRVNDRVTVSSSADEVMAIIIDLEAYPEWADGVQHVDIHERDAEGRPVEATFEVDAQVQRVTYRLHYTHEPQRLSWHLVDSNVLTQLDGIYDLTERGAQTDVEYTIEADISIPLPGFIKKRAAKVILNTGLRGLKRRVEEH